MLIVELRSGSGVLGQFEGSDTPYLVNQIFKAIRREHKGNPLGVKKLTVASNDVQLLNRLRQSSLQCKTEELLREGDSNTSPLIGWSLNTNLKMPRTKG